MKVAVFGYTDSTIGIIELLKSFNDEIVFLVIPENRKIEIKLKKKCKKEKITIIQQSKTGRIIREKKAEIAISYSYSQKIPFNILNSFPKGIVNIHGGLLPQYRGGNILNWVIINDEKHTGITLHYMDEHIDAGDIIDQVKIPININDTALTLRTKMEPYVIELLKKNWILLKNGNAPKKKQNEKKAKYWPARKPEDGEINFKRMTIRQIYNLIRGLVKPWPGAYFFDKKGKKIIIDKFVALNEITKLK